MADLRIAFGTPFDEQVAFLRQKLALPTQQWDDIQRSAHDRAFVVAGATKAALLADLHAAVVKAAEEGKGLGEFRKDFKAIVAKHGWTGWTGEGSPAGEAWRTRVIYQTNMATSYAAGRYRQLTEPAFVELHPFWRYIHRDGVRHPRPLHVAWHGLTLRHDHPFWDTHFPPNGWGCGCRVTPVTKAEGLRSAKAGLDDPPQGWDAKDPKTGAPVGVDKGFDYAMGRSWHPNLDSYPFEIAKKAVFDNLRDGVFARWHQRISDRVTLELQDTIYKDMSKVDMIVNLRRKLDSKEEYPIAVLSPDNVQRMGVKTQVVQLSAYDLIKQHISRQNQSFDALAYFDAQTNLDTPRLVVLQDGQMTLFVSDAAGRWYVAVLQKTVTKEKVYLKSFRYSSIKDALLQRKKGEVLLDTIES